MPQDPLWPIWTKSCRSPASPPPVPFWDPYWIWSSLRQSLLRWCQYFFRTSSHYILTTPTGLFNIAIFSGSIGIYLCIFENVSHIFIAPLILHPPSYNLQELVIYTSPMFLNFFINFGCHVPLLETSLECTGRVHVTCQRLRCVTWSRAHSKCPWCATKNQPLIYFGCKSLSPWLCNKICLIIYYNK